MVINIFEIVRSLKEQRIQSVMSLEQYELLYTMARERIISQKELWHMKRI